jgi:protein tyrosine/serine phosphatase
MKLLFLPQYRLSFLKISVVLLLPVLLTGCGNPWLLIGISDPNFGLAGEPIPTNLHVLDTGKAYRSGQPHGEELKNAINRFGLKTVLNLHGPITDTDWYDNEVDTCRQMNVNFADFPMDNNALPSPDTLKGIVNTLKNGPYPILIHCAAGVDRTGAISAIYRMLIAGDTKSVALKQLGVSKDAGMHALAEMYEPTDEWLAAYTQNYEQLISTPSLSQ